jgi:hypothetical protein
VVAAPLLAGLGMLLWAGLAPAQTPDPFLPPPPPSVQKHKTKPHDQFADQQGPVVPAQGMALGGAGDAASGEFQYLVSPPSSESIFRLESEADLFVRMEQEWRDNGHTDRLIFPDEPSISQDKYLGRAWPQYTEIAEPNYVCYKRLMFEQLNYERQGWDLGVLNPPLSAGEFFADVALLPYHAFTDPFRTFECSAGYCLPGDPTPLLIYPPELSASGTVAEASAILGVFAVFP